MQAGPAAYVHLVRNYMQRTGSEHCYPWAVTVLSRGDCTMLGCLSYEGSEALTVCWAADAGM